MCEHCGFKGHNKENYYRIVDFWQYFKIKKKLQGEVCESYTNNASIEDKSITEVQNQGGTQWYFLVGYFLRYKYE